MPDDGELRSYSIQVDYYYGCFNVGLGRRPVGGRRRTRIRSDIVKMTRPRAEGVQVTGAARPERRPASWQRPPSLPDHGGECVMRRVAVAVAALVIVWRSSGERDVADVAVERTLHE